MARLHLYRNISIIFIIVAAVILCAVFLLFYSEATIVLQSDAQTVNLNFVTEIHPSSTAAEIAKSDAIFGTVTISTSTVSQIFNASSTRSRVSGSNVVGTIRIKNTSNKAQKLVKTTQLQAENGVIVRTNAEVTVPAGGQVEVAVYPKEGVPFSNISSGSLVIIKLAEALQPKIYGEVISPLNAPTGDMVKYISDADVETAKKEIVAKAVEIATQAASTSKVSISGELVSFKLDKKIGDEGATFSMSAVIKYKTVKADESQLAAIIKRKAQKMNLNGLSADTIDLSQVSYSVIDSTNPEAIIIKVNYPVKAYLTETNELLAKKNFVDMTTDQIKLYGAKTGIIKNVDVIISPFWREKTPLDESRIKLIIQ